MGSVNRVSCECGYTSTVRVGGNRATHNEHSVFPFYCKNCGIVSVNVHGNTTECPYACVNQQTSIHTVKNQFHMEKTAFRPFNGVNTRHTEMAISVLNVKNLHYRLAV